MIRPLRPRDGVRNWADFVDFLRGTRAPAPRGPRRPFVSLLLVAASLVHLPLVYLLLRDVELPPPFPLVVGLVAMGLAWSGGVSLEGRRIGTVRFIAAVAFAEGALAFVPLVMEALGAARWFFVAIALLSAGALAVLARR